MATRLRSHLRCRPAYRHPVCKLAGGVAMRTAADITADPKPIPWSRRQLQTEMRKAGWKWIGNGWYEHTETGAHFDFETWHEGDNRPVWSVWAEKREVPPK